MKKILVKINNNEWQSSFRNKNLVDIYLNK